jgi:peptide-methionine (S)-S-oxide reductase
VAENIKTETATFGNGCFWCTEAVFQQLEGAEKVTSGYSGGHVENPSYEQVCGKQTGHAEVLIFYHNNEQKEKAEKYKQELEKSGSFDKPIVTAIEPFTNFYEAENYHRDYYKNHGSQPYCYFVIKPKMDKLKKVFADVLKQ